MSETPICLTEEEKRKSRLVKCLQRLSNSYLREVLILEEALISEQTKEVEDEKTLLEKRQT